MEICPPNADQHARRQSIIEAKNKIRLGHDECCNCCCCCSPQPACYKYVQTKVQKSFAPIPQIEQVPRTDKYVQPKVQKSYAPIRYYWRSDVPMENNTTYRLSYWEGPTSPVDPFHPDDSLTVADGPMTDETTHKLGFLGNSCVRPESPIAPCEKQWLGRGPK